MTSFSIIGTHVLFQQGSYQLEDSFGHRWHLGIITNIQKADDFTIRYSGRHLKNYVDDNKLIDYEGYSEIFTNLTIDKIRIFPNAFEVLQEMNETQHNE